MAFGSTITKYGNSDSNIFLHVNEGMDPSSEMRGVELDLHRSCKG